MKYSNPTGLPSVSNVVDPYEDTRWYKKEHTDRGNFCHGWAAADLLGLFTPEIPPLYEPYIKSYLAFKRHIKEVYVVEKRFTSKRGFCGQVDLVGLLDDVYNNKIFLLDWKTAQAASKIWQARLGGYSLLLEEHGITVGGCATVRLRGTPTKTRGYFPLVDQMNPQETRESQIDFLSAFRVYNNLMSNGQIYTNHAQMGGF